MSFFDEIAKKLRGLKPQERGDFITQLLNEKELHDALAQAGFTVQPTTGLERGVMRPYGVLSNIQKIDAVDLITLIKTIESISNIVSIDKIGEILRIKEAPWFKQSLIANSGWETGDLTGWTDQTQGGGTASVVGGVLSYTGNYVLKLTSLAAAAGRGMVSQTFDRPLAVADIVKFSVIAKSASGTPNLNVYYFYSDATSNYQSIPLSNVDTEYALTPTAASVAIPKYLVSILLSADAVNASIEYVDQLILIEREHVKTDREDLLVKDLDLVSDPSSEQIVLNSELYKRIKIYAFGYECDADGTYYFTGTIGGAWYKFGRRTTKGVYAQTLVHPIVCDHDTHFRFKSSGGATKLWIQYKIEV